MKLIDITKSYGQTQVLKKFNLEINEKEITCILGPSGCGKTTLLNIISNLIDYEGKVEKDTGRISYIFQNKRLLTNLTVYDNLDYVLSNLQKDRQKRKEIINKILEIVELSSWQNKYPKELSGGMAQRVSMARAFVYPSSLLLMDEPFKGLDILLKKRLISAFLKLWQNDERTVVFVTHDIDEAILISDRIILLSKNGNILLERDINLNKNCRDFTEKSLIELRNDIYRKA